ncbi:hypothetical protein NP493_321g02003 [Ridgeia piscesae]|uniref:Uncharacterized protein n=1 Tax=Ridgeia piscesae TaxID=27915 RepID=A0AAD9NUU0_RIDPI|nr:hypothetical protein NP493_321g02003 [Ridgeia piscesae]
MITEIMNFNRLLWWLPWPNVYMCYDYVHLYNLSDISAFETTTYSNVKCKSLKDTYCLKSCLLSAVRKSLYVYDSVVNSILNRTFKIRKV